ncbi:hypothetical protein ACFLU6_07975, partial [Acidobacteriota bacterium]
MKHAGLVVCVLALVSFVCTCLQADPRWWWDDAPLSSVVPSEEIADVDIDVVYAYAGNALGAFFVAWIVPPQGPAQGSLWLTASFNGGCSFCEPVRVAEVNGPDATNVSLAVAGNMLFFYTIQIAYQENGNIRIAYDIDTVPDDSDPSSHDIKCQALQEVASNRKFYTANAFAGTASKPDITGDVLPGRFTHFYVVWQDDRFDSTTEVMFARDLTGLGNWEPEQFLTNAVPVPHFFFEPLGENVSPESRLLR